MNNKYTQYHQGRMIATSNGWVTRPTRVHMEESFLTRLIRWFVNWY